MNENLGTQTNPLLGYPPEARLLIVNADDFGMRHSVNEAVFCHIRQSDFDFLVSQQAKDMIQEEGIILLDYRALQNVWRSK